MIFLVILVCHGAVSDDGSWSESFTTESGSIYSTEESQDIALEKELLVFTGSETHVYFQFRNLTDKDLVVDAGFPVKHNINSYAVGDFMFVPISPYGPSEVPLVNYFKTQEFVYEEDERRGYLEDAVLLVPENNNREFISAAAADSEVSFSIMQDGSVVPIDQVLLERVADPDELSLTFHYKHQLKFGPGQTSVVEVRYDYDLHFGSEGGGFGDVYRWDYVIGTGGTWSGAIEEFYLVVPGKWSDREIVKDLNVVFDLGI